MSYNNKKQYKNKSQELFLKSFTFILTLELQLPLKAV